MNKIKIGDKLKNNFYLSDYFKKRRDKGIDLKQLVSKDKKVKTSVPKNALIELTNACNHACVFCYNPEMNRKTTNLEFKLYQEFIIKCFEEGVEEVGLYSTGEPFMTKKLDQYIKYAKERGIRRVYITTNGALATFEKVKKCIDFGLDSIKFSINAGSRETYKSIHGYDDFDKVLKNISDIYKYINEKKIRLQILCSYVFTDLTFNEIESFIEKYGYLFEDIAFWKAGNQGGHTLERSTKITKKINENSENLSKNNFQPPCEMLWNRIHFTSEGYLTACCTDYENSLVYKKFEKNETLKSQYNSSNIVNLRKKHLENNLDRTLCKNCIYNLNEPYEKILDTKSKNSKKNIKKEKHLKERINLIEKL